MRYAVVIEKADGNLSAYAPDLPGCVATGENVAAVEKNIREAIRFHIDGLREDRLPIPEPSAHCRLRGTRNAAPLLIIPDSAGRAR